MICLTAGPPITENARKSLDANSRKNATNRNNANKNREVKNCREAGISKTGLYSTATEGGFYSAQVCSTYTPHKKRRQFFWKIGDTLKSTKGRSNTILKVNKL
jgi:hypothetical protein